MKRRGLWIALALAVALAVGVATYVASNPSPERILASIDVPPSPVLSPDDALAAFRTAPGFRVELVASEPLVVDPVAMDWDDEGRLYVVEMRGFMPNIEGEGEDAPVGRVVVLEDDDGDGRMDRSDVFLDELVMPRAIAVLPQGVLVGSPPDLWLCRPAGEPLRCVERSRLGDYANSGPNPEHLENGLLPAIDGWIYNAKSTRRFRFTNEGFEIGATAFRGQFGIAQDDEGNLFYNHNSGFLYGDAIPAEVALRSPATSGRLEKPGINVDLSEGARVFGVRVAAGLNRAYTAGALRRDGRQDEPTGVSGIAIQRGDQYGPEYAGDAFVPEAAGGVVAHFDVERDGLELRAEHRLEKDAQWGKREFLASTDERFRPVDAKVGPDGAIWVIDMYRGVIQHAHYVSDHLRDYVAEHDLEAPGEQGRIWRIVRDDRPIERRPPPLATSADALAALDHANGWVRDRAQRRLASGATAKQIAALRALERFGAAGRAHALFALAQLRELDDATFERALADGDARVRRAALRAREDALASLPPERAERAREQLTARLDDAEAAVRLAALHAIGSLPRAQRPIDALLAAARTGDALSLQAAVSGLAGLERDALEREVAREAASPTRSGEHALVAELAAAAHLAAQAGHDAAGDVTSLLDFASASPDDGLRVAMLEGIADAQTRAGSRRVELAAAHPIFAIAESEDASASARLREAIERVRPHITWPGDPRPGGARALTAEEEALRARGEELFATSCANCHGANGAGLPGLAPSLVGSPWVRDADAWIVRIALHGLTGPVEIDGEVWRSTMPGHAHDPRFDDYGVAAVATFARRAWGHADDPVSPETARAIRAETTSRSLPWTTAELEALEVEHRLDRYVGVYQVPLIGIRIHVRRDGAKLAVGRDESGAAGVVDEVAPGTFSAPELSIRFESGDDGRVTGARLHAQGRSVPLTRAD